MEIINTNIERIECKCKRCGTLFAYTKYDIQKEYNTYRTGIETSNTDVEEYVVCPICKRTVTLRTTFNTF